MQETILGGVKGWETSRGGVSQSPEDNCPLEVRRMKNHAKPTFPGDAFDNAGQHHVL